MSAESSEREFAAWAESLHAEYDAFLRQSWAAMQAARKGHWIEDTEEHVRAAGEAFRQQALEKLKNKPFNPGPVAETTITGIEAGYTLETGYSGTYKIDPVAGTSAPNRLARITVTLNYSAGGGGRAGGQAQQVRLETMRAE